MYRLLQSMLCIPIIIVKSILFLYCPLNQNYLLEIIIIYNICEWFKTLGSGSKIVFWYNQEHIISEKKNEANA